MTHTSDTWDVQYQRPAMAQSIHIQGRIKWAKQIALEQRDRGLHSTNADTLRGVLKQEAQDLGFPTAFDALSDKDLVEVALSVVNGGRIGVQPFLSTIPHRLAGQ